MKEPYKPTKELETAMRHVGYYYPTLSIVVFDRDGRWQYMDEDFNGFKFNKKIDVSILEAASDSLPFLPFVYQK